MESAPARAQSRIPPFRLSKTVQPAPHKGQRRWLPHFSGQSSSADAKNGAKKRVFLKCLLSPRGTRAAGHSVPTHTMLRAALKHQRSRFPKNKHFVPTHTMLRAALKRKITNLMVSTRDDVSTHTMLRAALTAKRLCVSFRSHRAVFVCKNRTAILTMRRTDVSIEIQKGTADRRLPLIFGREPRLQFGCMRRVFSFIV